MVGSRLPQTVVATVLVGIVVASVSTMALAGGATGIAQAGDTPPSGEVFQQGDMGVWERSIVTLRADDDDAAYALPNAAWQIESTSGDQASLNRDPVPVYDDGQEVRLTFDPNRAQKADDYLAGQKTQLIAAHLEETGNGDVPRTTGEAFDLLDTDSADDANENASFSVAEKKKLATGENEYFDSVEAGHTVYFLVTVKDGDGVTVSDDGDVTGVDGEVTVVGLEHVVARAGAGSVDAPSKVKPGETASFDVDASELEAADAGETINQGVVVYDEETYVNQRFLIELNDDVSTDFDVDEDATFHSDIDEVNGVARLDDRVSIFGRQVGDNRVTGSAGLGFLFDFVGEQAGTDMGSIEDDSADTVVLDASTTFVSGSSADRTVEVETFKNWSTGEYRWVYVGMGQDSADMVTQTGTIHVKKKSTGGSSGGDPGGDPGGDDDDDGSGGDPGAGTGGDPGGDDGAGTGGTGAPDAGNETETEKDAGTGGDDDDDDDETDEPEPASIEITDATLSADEITAGDSVNVSVTLENDGGKEGSATIRIRANESVVATEQVTVGAGETVTETVSVTFDEAGTYEISASGTSAGTLTVTEAGGGDDTPGGAEPPEDGGGLPVVAIGVVVVFAGGAGAFYVFWIR
ncbi:hypothetical protein SAMN05216559_0297 [Halomicrobium zhouii]|uniref:CARDB domain-containing protein n=1 Tax=Halomicrobium zhouii TaxID=767519 RepID=A0A1I6K717_9EURY|nr:CARDB domain-containing protein [Halomicrobium zhouii]SFR87022.1 hypothetical protein SAMN05216559_0297 [Halomicrobium zhouii]